MSNHHTDAQPVAGGTGTYYSSVPHTIDHRRNSFPEQLMARFHHAGHATLASTDGNANCQHLQAQCSPEPDKIGDDNFIRIENASVKEQDAKMRYQNLDRVWKAGEGQARDTGTYGKTPMERFEQESIDEQPWNTVSRYDLCYKNVHDEGNNKSEEGYQTKDR